MMNGSSGVKTKVLDCNIVVEEFERKLRNYEVHTISFQTFFVWALLLIVHTWNSSSK